MILESRDSSSLRLSTSRFGRYEPLRLLGHGGMADVWSAAWHSPSGERVLVALKRILPHLCHDPAVVRMFAHEARLSMRLAQRNIVRTLDVGEVSGQPYIALELLDGVDLRQILRSPRNRPSLGFALWVVHELCAALAYAHRLTDERGHPLGVVHRDVSPSNVMLEYDGSIKLLDFGIAKALGDASTEATQYGVVKGKIGYLAPEVLGGAPFDHRADLFALGVILHELLTHQRLFVGDHQQAALARNRACQVAPPSAVNPEVPLQVDEIAERALARDPNHRYASAEDMFAALTRALERWPWSRAQTAALVQAHRQQPSELASSPSLRTDAATRPFDDDWMSSDIAALVAQTSTNAQANAVSVVSPGGSPATAPRARRARVIAFAGCLALAIAAVLHQSMGAGRRAPAPPPGGERPGQVAEATPPPTRATAPASSAPHARPPRPRREGVAARAHPSVVHHSAPAKRVERAAIELNRNSLFNPFVLDER
jgi:serine/threonine-protein kinase